MNLTNPAGWAKRRAKAARKRHATDPVERARIRAIRAALYRGDAPEGPVEKPDNAGPTKLADVMNWGVLEPKTFDLSGNWMQTRVQVRNALGIERVPGSKAEAARLLNEAGYTVEGYDAEAS